MKNKVFHTQEEHRSFLLSAAVLHFEGPRLAWTGSLFTINSKLEEGRQLGRGTIYTNSKKWLREAEYLYKESLPKSGTEKPKDVDTPPPPTPTNPVENLEGLLSKVTDQIVDMLFQRIATKLSQRVLQLTKVEGEIQEIPVVRLPERQIKEKVLIVGLLPVQQNEISKAYGDFFNLRYQESDENIHRLEQRTLWADYIILNCTKISHKHRDMVMKNGDGKVINKVFGGVSAIKGTLEGLKTKCQPTHQQ